MREKNFFIKAKTKNENINFSKREELFFCSRKGSAQDTDGENISCFWEEKVDQKNTFFNFFDFVGKKFKKKKTKQTQITENEKWLKKRERDKKLCQFFLWSTQQRKNKQEIQKTKYKKMHKETFFLRETSKQENRGEIFPFLYKSYTELKNTKRKENQKWGKTLFLKKKKKSPKKKWDQKRMRNKKRNFVSKADLHGVKWKTKWQDISTQKVWKQGEIWENRRKQKGWKTCGKHWKKAEKKEVPKDNTERQ